MFGPINETNARMKDLTPREIAYFAPLLAAAFWVGLYPKPVMDVLARPVAKLVRQVDPGFYQGASLDAAQAAAARTGMAAMQPKPGGEGEP
jgi:NADH-quinone oxidoreductase subunit M